ncbi:hypothetical protein F1559_005155 [Cyanidiococcus yangmingshanensis]|uniref:Uncharacterized protein n=1 Tax=Cyanidiococcus yangmingshanensis TaxID=2690220 RepID=A0A7J7IT39_9RHOD|nr:hypothetical protein F1559_005155 [Cyanidiococcus yangmingshanensis]
MEAVPSTHEWLDDVLLQEQMLVRPWMMPAIAATDDDSAAVEDALLREADRANFETLMLRAMTELRLCHEWFVPGPLHGPIEERPPIMKSSAELFPSIAKLQAWKQIFLGCLESRDGTRIPAFLRVDGTAERLLEAIHGRPLSPRESYLVPERLVNVDGTLLHRLNLQPAELLLFHGRHPIGATARIVRHLLDTCTCRLGEYVEALASLPVTVSNLSLIRAVDRKLLFRIYVSRVCSCWQPPLMNPNDFASVRLVELFAIFALRVLDERPQWITGETCHRARDMGTGRVADQECGPALSVSASATHWHRKWNLTTQQTDALDRGTSPESRLCREILTQCSARMTHHAAIDSTLGLKHGSISTEKKDTLHACNRLFIRYAAKTYLQWRSLPQPGNRTP